MRKRSYSRGAEHLSAPVGIRNVRPKRYAALFAAAAAALVATRAHADTYYLQQSGTVDWDSTHDAAPSWLDSTTNNPNINLPPDGSTVNVMQSGTIGVSNTLVNFNTAYSTGLAQLTIESGNRINQSSGTSLLAVTGDMYIGFDASSFGQYNQSAGTASLSTLYLGYSPSSSGTYTLSGGLLTESTNLYVGYSASASFMQSGGSHVGNVIAMGYTNGSRGTYTLNGPGSLSADQFIVGWFANGIYNQSAGVANIGTSWMFLGAEQGSSGTANISGGSLTINGYLQDGYQGNGTVNHTGGTVHASYLAIGDLTNGTAAASIGTYNLSNTASLVVDNDLSVGDSGIGFLNQSGGSASVGGFLLVGYRTGSSGSVNLSGGLLSVNTEEDIGYNGSGQFFQSGGTNQINNSNVLVIGDFAGSSGTYTLSGGLLTGPFNTFVGAAGDGNFVQTGGTHSAQILILGFSTGSAGVYSLSGNGVVNTSQVVVGWNGSGTFNQSSGTVNTGQLFISFSNGAGLYSLTGGSLSATSTGNFGQFMQTGGSASLGAISGAGTMSIGGGTASASALALSLQQSAVTVGSLGVLNLGASSLFNNSNPNGPVVVSGGLASPMLISGALTITNGGHVLLNPSTPGHGQTNSVGSLAIGPRSGLDIGNHTLIVQNAPDETVIGKYLSNGYSGGFWNGSSSSGGAITSVVAFNDNSGATSIGYGNSADFTFGGSTSPYRVGGPKALSGNQVVVAPALAGDLLLSGTVGPNELALMLGSFGTTGNDWAFGNIDYDAAGLVGPNDLSLLLSNFGHSSAGFTGTSAKTSAKSLTSTAKPSLVASESVAPPPADGIQLLIYLNTGDVQLQGNDATLVSSIVLTSNANGLIGGTTFTPAFTALFNTSASNTNGLIDEFNTFTNGSTVDGIVDLGDIYNTIQNPEDIQFQFSEKGVNRGSLQTGLVVYPFPEPTTLSLLAVASAGLLARRRRRLR